MQAPRPPRDKYTAPYWDALQQGSIKLPRCRACGHWLFPIGPCCSSCLSDELEWQPLSGRGEVWSYIVYHHAFDPAFKDKLPYNVAIVKLDEGPRLISNVVGVADAETLTIDQRLHLLIQNESGTAVPRFALTP